MTYYRAPSSTLVLPAAALWTSTQVYCLFPDHVLGLLQDCPFSHLQVGSHEYHCMEHL